jgi:hypothetical protein
VGLEETPALDELEAALVTGFRLRCQRAILASPSSTTTSKFSFSPAKRPEARHGGERAGRHAAEKR